MLKDYGKPGITPVAFDFENSGLTRGEACMALSRKDVLGIVHSAFEELGGQSERFVAVKHDVLGEVSEGRLAHALRAAIVGAGKAGCTCCS
jgi:hypothetical protein